MSINYFLVFLPLLLLTPPTFISGTTPPTHIALSGCKDSCGAVSIPYPFGTTAECFRNSSFRVTCNETTDPPKLFLGSGNLEVTDILIDAGKLKLMQWISKRCYDQEGTQTYYNRPWLNLPYLYSVNNTLNKFTIVGCDSYGYTSGRRWGDGDRYYSTGCVATCQQKADLENNSCMGLGCCQVSGIPEEIRYANVSVASFNNHTSVSSISDCTYGFIVEEDAFTFHPDNLTNLWNVSQLPIVVDWVISNETCETAQMNKSSYACQYPNSMCDDDIGQGYRCQCEPGYEGNPYLPTGCIDIDECKFPTRYPCKYNCTNSPGSFMCNCFEGFHGNATIDQCIVDESSSNKSKNDESRIYKPIAGTLLAMIVAALAISLVHFELKRRRLEKMKHVYFLRNGGMLLQEKLTRAGMSIGGMEREMASNTDVAKIFSATELQSATNNFHNNMIIGQGGFGTVYKGFLKDNRLVAIKKSKEIDPAQIDQFVNEIAVLSRVSHRNIVKLLGCCLETPVPLLVYEFINNGTLDDHIHNQARRRFLDWNMRLKIASETADVLSYLHSAASTPIIHRDVKSANILLDHNFEAKVSDFGASRLVPLDQTQLSTMVQGTFGYLDPEYMQTNQLTEKSDVYSFGVVLLELISGMTPLCYNRPEEERSLTNFFLRKLQQGRLSEVFDETVVDDKGNLDQLNEVAKLARVCINVKGHDRPSMREVAMELEGLRLGGKHSWVKFEQKVEEMQSSNEHLLDSFVNDNAYSTSIGYISFRDQEKLNGGR